MFSRGVYSSPRTNGVRANFFEFMDLSTFQECRRPELPSALNSMPTARVQLKKDS